MDKKTFDRVRMITAAVLAGIVSISVVQGSYVVPLVATLTAVAMIAVMKKKVTGVIDDERDYQVAGNAARWTISVFAILSALGSIILMAQRNANPAYELLGSTLAYSACFVLLLNSGFFYYFSNKGDGAKTNDKN